MLCNLCQLDKKLVNAHILPKWSVKELRGNKNFLVEFDRVAGPKRVQTNAYDPNILCKECDSEVVGKYDTYASRFFKEARIENLVFIGKSDEGVPQYIAEVTNHYDYDKLAIFLLSVLWRASISDLPEFENIKLGKYEEVVRSFILSGKVTGSKFNFYLIKWSFSEKDFPARNLVIPPKLIKIDGFIHYNFIFCDYEVIVSFNRLIKELESCRIDEEKAKLWLTDFKSTSLYDVIENTKTSLTDDAIRKMRVLRAKD